MILETDDSGVTFYRLTMRGDRCRAPPTAIQLRALLKRLLRIHRPVLRAHRTGYGPARGT